MRFADDADHYGRCYSCENRAFEPVTCPDCGEWHCENCRAKARCEICEEWPCIACADDHKHTETV